MLLLRLRPPRATATQGSPGTSALISRELLRKVRLLELKTRLQVHDVFSGRYHSVFKGQGMDFSEVREYVPGDDIRMIDWNVSARMGHPYVKVFREERELTVMLLVDVSASQEYGTVQSLKRELAAELTALLALCALANNDKVGLLLFTDRVEHFVAPKKGRRHVLRLIRDVLAFRPQSRGTSLASAVEYVLHALTKKSVVFVISDFEDDGYQKPLKVAGRKHDLIVVELSDPREQQLVPAGWVPLRDPETGALQWFNTSSAAWRTAFAEQVRRRRAEREAFFRTAGIDRVELSVARPYLNDLVKLFRTRARRR